MAYIHDDLELLLTHHLEEALAAGHPPMSPSSWRSQCRQEVLKNEKLYPGYITRAANGLRARANGQRITGWRETRGTHGIDHVPDPTGTDRPPWM